MSSAATPIFSLKWTRFQRESERNCGWHCCSMISGFPVEFYEEEFGKRRGTSEKDLSFALRRYGTDCDVELTRFSSIVSLPALCILDMRVPQEKRRGGHWAVAWKGMVYDSCLGRYPLTLDYLKHYRIKIRNYLKVEVPNV